LIKRPFIISSKNQLISNYSGSLYHVATEKFVCQYATTISATAFAAAVGKWIEPFLTGIKEVRTLKYERMKVKSALESVC